MSCKKCKNLQKRIEGTAPERQKYIQPTMYDHMQTFCDFRQKSDAAADIKQQEKTLIKLNKNFTNFDMVENNDDQKLDECMSHFSTQSIAKFRNKLRHNAEKMLCAHHECNEPVQVDDDEDSTYRTFVKGNPPASDDNYGSLCIKISRSPINCPVSTCKGTIGITSLLSHFLRDHCVQYSVDLEDIDADHRSVLMFDENELKFNENVFLGVLAYGGRDGTRKATQPGLIGISLPNAFLPDKYVRFINHLPILIMGCKTSLAAHLDDPTIAKKVSNPNDKLKEIVVIWLATVETTKPVHATMTAFSHDMTTSQSTVIKVRNLRDSQVPMEFVSHETDYLWLSRGELNTLSDEGKSSIELEIIIHEFE